MAAKAALEKSAESERPPLVVGVGASAGGLEAFQELLTAIGDAPGMAIVFVQHLDPHSKSLLAELLTKTTAMPIVELTGREKLKSGTVYLCPPQRLLETKNGFVSIVENDHETRLHNVIDYFLHSIAQDLGERGVGVILSGGGSDGTLGLKAISDAEGLTFAQEPTSAKFDSMPRNAATTGVADHVLTPAEIAKELLQYSAHLNDIRSPKTRDHLQNQIVEAIPAIAEQLTSVTSHNFKHYKTSTLSRRILRRMQVLKMSNVSEYVRFLQGSDEETQTLFRELLIGVTAFFRDPEAFESLAENVLPKLFENRSAEDVVRIWVAAAPTGAEAYTMAILCREALDRCDKLAPCGYVQIFATDIDERALQTARVGAYPVGIEDHISVERLKRFFTKRGKRYHVTKELRDMVLFSAHNLISDPPFSRLDLISCRNLLIYLGPHLQKKLIPVFHYALRPSGYLFLGPSENISSHAELFRTLDAKFRISQRKGTAVGSTNTISLLPSAIEASRTGSARSPDETADLTEVRQRILLDEFAPKSCIIDESGQVLNSSSNMQKYLSLSDGDFQNNVIKMAASGLRIGLRAAIAEARKSRRRVQHENLSIRLGDQIQRVMLTVQPMPRLGEDDSLFMVVFHDVGLPVNRDAIDDTVSGSTTDADSIIAQLERELETTREDLDKSLQDMEAANEELRSSNEELLSINEELQSANEELETSKEEIRSGSDAVARAHSDLENLLRSSQIATVFLDDELLIRSFTPAISEIYGLIATDIGRPLERFVPHVNDMPPLPNPQQIQDGSPIEHTVTADSGKTFIRRVLPYKSHTGVYEGIVVTFLDVTDLQQSKNQLAQREAQLKTITDAIPPLIAFVDQDYRFRFVNAAYAKQWQRPIEQLVNQKVIDVVGADNYRGIEPHLRKSLAGETEKYDFSLQLPSGEVLHKEVTYVPDRNANGSVSGVHVVVNDVTERKQAERDLATAKTRLDLSLQISEVAPWNWDTERETVFSNPLLNRLFGFEPDAEPTMADFIERIDSATREQVSAAIQRSIQTGDTYDEEYSVHWPNGEIRHLRARGQAQLSEDGTLEDFFGVVLDITERKRRELETADREAHLRRVIDNQLGMVGVLNIDGTLVEANAAAIKAANLNRSDVIGRKFWECYWWNYNDEVANQLRTAISLAATGKIVRYDATVRMAGDTRMLIDFMMAPVFDDNGDVEYLIPSGVDISDRLKAENEIRENEQRLKMALKAGGMAAWEWTPEGSVWTDELYTLLGISSDETPSPETFFRYVHPDDLDGIKQAWTGVTAQGALYDHEFRIIRPDGETRWLVGMGQVVRDPAGNVQRVFGLNCDITGQKEVQEQILTSEQRFREMANAAPAMVWVTDENHECTFLSQSWCDFTGQTEKEGLGIGWLKVVHPDDREATKITFLSAAEQRESFELDFRLQTADGRYRWVINAGKPRFNDTKDFLGYVGSVTDAHERHEALLALNEARQAAEAANESKSAFLANMSHEIRTPMTAILGYADLVASLIDHSEATAHLQTIRRNGAFLLDIINDILDLSKIEADKLDIIQERFDPTRLVEDVRSIMEVRAKEGGIELSVEYHGEIPMEIESDSKRLKQILINLVGNAIKFTKQGGVKVVVTCCRPLSSTSEDSHVPETNGDTLRFDIIDSGIGMNRKQQKKLFQPFSQGDHSVNREFGGTGLGLAISQRLASMLGGKITVTSEEGKGSTFSFSIAIGNIGNVVMIRPQMTAEPGTGGAPSEDIRLSCHALIVDDRRDIRFLSRKFLTDAGATVSEAEDGEVAVTVVREAMTSGTPPDIIILDMQMPKLDGYETAKALRRMDYPGPIIALTADAMQGDMSRCIECGCNDYLSKPIDKDEMLKKVKQFVTR